VVSKKEPFLLKKPEEKWINNSAKTQNSILEKYGSMDKYYDEISILCKVKEEGNLFVTAEGLILPCCWTAGRMYKWWQRDPKTEQIWDFIDKIGGKEKLDGRQGLEKVFETGIFELIEASWSKKSCTEGKLKVCSMKCGVEFDPFLDQFT
jgi:hypothetical protein